jgi:hypothetical protein
MAQSCATLFLVAFRGNPLGRNDGDWHDFYLEQRKRAHTVLVLLGCAGGSWACPFLLVLVVSSSFRRPLLQTAHETERFFSY